MANIRLSFYVWILFILGSSWSTHCESNTRSATQPESRIIGGTFATPGEFPHQIFMTKQKGKNRHDVCGGTIISKTHILLAAHCVYCAKTSQVEISAGILALSDTEKLSPIIPVSNIYVHPCYFEESDPEKRTHWNDIAIVELSKRLEFSRTINSIALDETGLALPGIETTTVGWGQTESLDPKSKSNILKKAKLDVIADDFGRLNTSSQILTNNRAQFVCSGDSGGPLLCPDSRGSGKNVLCGITSLAFANVVQPCIGPSAFTRISHYQNWIKAIQSGNIGSSDGCVGKPREPDCPPSYDYDSGSSFNRAIRSGIYLCLVLHYTWEWVSDI